MPLTSDSIGAVPYGPQTDALLAAIGQATELINRQGAQLLDALDITSPTWDPSRPVWHLQMIEVVYGARPEPTLVPDLRYRLARARIFARHSRTRIDDLVTVFSALIGAEGVDPARMRIMCAPLVMYLIFSAEDAPPPAIADRVIELLRTCIQDVAGFGVLTAPPGVDLGAVFTLDIGPGLDVGALAGP